MYRRHTCLIGSFVREGVLEFALGPIRTSVSVISSELPTENPQPFHISTQKPRVSVALVESAVLALSSFLPCVPFPLAYPWEGEGVDDGLVCVRCGGGQGGAAVRVGWECGKGVWGDRCF